MGYGREISKYPLRYAGYQVPVHVGRSTVFNNFFFPLSCGELG